MSSILFVIVLYSIVAWFAICMRQSLRQMIAKSRMIALINRNKIASGDYELIKHDLTFLTMLKAALKLMIFR